MEALVNKIIPFSSVDGPGNRSVVFFQGCNLNCKYCHNPETININSNICSDNIRLMTPLDVMNEISKQIPYISGITTSGGECMLNPDFLTELFRLAKSNNLNTLIDSNGTILFENFPDLISVTDGVMLDIKAFNNLDFNNITGGNNKIVLDNFKYLSSINKLSEIRCVICPDLYDYNLSVSDLIYFIKPYYTNNSFKIKLIKFRPNGVRSKYQKFSIPTDEYMDKIKQIFISNELNNVVII